jgi:hypothetical protein
MEQLDALNGQITLDHWPIAVITFATLGPRARASFIPTLHRGLATSRTEGREPARRHRHRALSRLT